MSDEGETAARWISISAGRKLGRITATASTPRYDFLCATKRGAMGNPDPFLEASWREMIRTRHRYPMIARPGA